MIYHLVDPKIMKHSKVDLENSNFGVLHDFHHKKMVNRCLVMKQILPQFSEIPDFRQQFKISNYLINS